MNTTLPRALVATLIAVPVLIGTWGGFCVASMVAQMNALAVPFAVAFLSFSVCGILLALIHELLFIVLPAVIIWLLVKAIKNAERNQ